MADVFCLIITMNQKLTLTLTQRIKQSRMVDITLFEELRDKVVQYDYSAGHETYSCNGIVGKVGEHHVEILHPAMLGDNIDIRMRESRVVLNKKNISSISEADLSVDEYRKRYDKATL